MKNKLSSLFLSSIAASSILLAPALHAAAITWDAGGGADKNWSTDANWSDNAPATGDDVTFDATGALASGTTSTVDTSISIASLTYNFESATLKHTTAIAAGQTLTVAGNFLLSPSTTATLKTDVILTGATGSLTVNGTSFQVGQKATTVVSYSTQSLDMSGLGTLTANLTASGIFRVAPDYGGTYFNNGTLVKLAATSTITANIIGVGDTGGRGALHTLKLGSTANTFKANTISIGSQGAGGRSSGELSFETGTGTLKLRAADGTSAVTAMNLLNSSFGTANLITGTANFAGHDVDAKITTLTMGRRSATGTASANATFTFDTGTLEVGTLNLGEIANAGANAGTINAIMNIGGGTATFGAINMATSSSAAGTTTIGTLNFTNGTTTVNGDIIKGGGGLGTTTANLNLKGGTLDMTAGNIGSLANSINLTAESGTLKNVAQINGGGSLVKTTAGTLVLDGTNTYTGATIVSAGTLQIGSGGSTGSLSTSSAITNNGTLAFSRNNTITQGTDFANVISGTGNVTQSGSGTLALSGNNTYTGATSVSNGVLKLTLPEALSTNTAVNISTTTGAKIDLNFSGTVTVKSLTVDGELLTRNKVYSSANLPIAFAPGDGLLYTLDGAPPKGTMIRFF